MAKKGTNMMATVGAWSFILGVIIALLIGLFPSVSNSTWAVSLLIVLGLVVGFLNVTGHESTPFLLATVSLVIVSSFGGAALANVKLIGAYLEGILNAIIVFVIPATIIVALKSIYAMARDE